MLREDLSLFCIPQQGCHCLEACRLRQGDGTASAIEDIILSQQRELAVDFEIERSLRQARAILAQSFDVGAPVAALLRARNGLRSDAFTTHVHVERRNADAQGLCRLHGREISIIHKFTIRLTINVNMNFGPIQSPSQVLFTVDTWRQIVRLS